jgi:hypothetical protein
MAGIGQRARSNSHRKPSKRVFPNPARSAVVDLGFGLHIIKVVERDYAGLEPFNGASEDSRKLRANRGREYKKIVDELKRKATVVVHPQGRSATLIIRH